MLFAIPLHTVLQSNQKETDYSDDLKATWKDNIKLDLKKEDGGMAWFSWLRIRDSHGSLRFRKRFASHHTKGAELLDQLRDYWHIKQSTANEQCTRNNWEGYCDITADQQTNGQCHAHHTWRGGPFGVRVKYEMHTCYGIQLGDGC